MLASWNTFLVNLGPHISKSLRLLFQTFVDQLARKDNDQLVVFQTNVSFSLDAIKETVFSFYGMVCC